MRKLIEISCGLLFFLIKEEVIGWILLMILVICFLCAYAEMYMKALEERRKNYEEVWQ